MPPIANKSGAGSPCPPRVFESTSIHWFRRDLRLTDNVALSEAAARCERLVLVFILDGSPEEWRVPRKQFRLACVESLRRDIEAAGGRLVIRKGPTEVELVRISREYNAVSVFANKVYGPDQEALESRVFNALNRAGVGFELFKDAVIWEEREVLTKSGNPFTVFTPYSKAWKAKRQASGPRAAWKPRRALKKDSKPGGEMVCREFMECELASRTGWIVPGEAAGRDQMEQFLKGPVYEYAAKRDLPALSGTSRLSAHLACGTIGIRELFAGLKESRAAASRPEQRASCDVFEKELIWREFYQQVLHNFPHVAKGAFRPEYNALKWSDNYDHLEAWRRGRTGYPIVDAAMRCLNETGWMHNRLRMVVAMFLTKDLLIHWREGEDYFMRKLVDGDLAANNGGWQWSAGTGTDAAPYFRIFNPVSQGKRFDPDGKFVRRWVPELSSIPAEDIQEPWKHPLILRASGYPERVVLHEEQRSRCLAMFKPQH